VETDFSGEQSYSQANPSDPSSFDPGSIGSDTIQAGTTNNFGTSFADDAQATVDPSNVLSQASFNQAMGITATNPFPNSIFSRLFGAENVSYAGMGMDLQGLANDAYDRYRNPLTEEGTVRSGLSAGDRTVLGNVVEIDKPMSTTETLARTGIGALMPGPVGLVLSQLGTSQKAIAPNLQGSAGINYDPKLDPRSPEYEGPTSFLGKMGSDFERLLFGGAQPVREGIGALQNVLN